MIPITAKDWVLHAFVDGELEPSEKIEVENYLAQDHDARVTVKIWQMQKEALKQTFKKTVHQDLPWGIQLPFKMPPPHHVLLQILAAAAVTLAIIAGGFVGYLNFAVSGPDKRSFVETALSAHVVYASDSDHPVEVLASQHLVSWLSERLDRAVNAPDLSAHDFRLLGGRLLHENRQPAAQLMYMDSSNRRLSLYIANNFADRQTAFRIEQNGDYTTCYWFDGATAYAVTGQLPVSQLIPLARHVYEAVDD